MVTHDKLSETLNKIAPNGIDVFFENVGSTCITCKYLDELMVEIMRSLPKYSLRRVSPSLLTPLGLLFCCHFSFQNRLHLLSFIGNDIINTLDYKIVVSVLINGIWRHTKIEL